MMRVSTSLLIVVLLLVLTGCGAPNRPVPAPAPAPEPPKPSAIYTTVSGDTVSVNPDSVKTNDREVVVTLQFTKKQPVDGVKNEVWEATFKPAERMINIQSKKLYDDNGKQLSSGTSSLFWEYVPRGSTTDDIMQAVVAYCRDRNLTLNTTPAPYDMPEFRYIAKSTANNAFYFYRPASVRSAGDSLSVEVLIVLERLENGVRYSLNTVLLNPVTGKYQTASQTYYDQTGKQTSSNKDPKWFDISPNSVYDMLRQSVLEYARANKIQLTTSP